MYQDNDWYGHRDILAEYCAHKNSPAFATILHGWIWKVDSSRKGRRIKSAPYLMWNNRHLRSSKLNGVENVISVGAPFLYLCKINERVNYEPEGTLFFPQHSTTQVFYKTPHLEFINIIEKQYPAPYTVSIFYNDPNFDQIEKFYKDAGWLMFSAGPRSSSGFLRDLHHCIAKHSYVLSNDLTSAIFYAAYLGRSIRILSQNIWPNSLINNINDDQSFTELVNILLQGLSGDDARNIGVIELGEDCMRSPEELREILGWSSLLRSSAARCIAQLIDLKKGTAIRRGERDLKS